jgi:hypothetical protein
MPRDAAVATGAPVGTTTDAPLATRSDVIFSPPWVVLGQNLVDTRSGRRMRSLHFGEIVFAGDGQRFALFDGREVVLGGVNDRPLISRSG